MMSIIELGDVCARQRAVSLDLFEQLGALVTADATPAGDEQQLFAKACHQHAWHAELWLQRAPTIPPVQGNDAFEQSVVEHRGANEPVADAESYRRTVSALVSRAHRSARSCRSIARPVNHTHDHPRPSRPEGIVPGTIPSHLPVTSTPLKG